MVVYFPIFKIYVTLCLIGLFEKSIIQLKPTRQYPVPVVTSCVITAEPVKSLEDGPDPRISLSLDDGILVLV